MTGLSALHVLAIRHMIERGAMIPILLARSLKGADTH